eukprot:2377419-Rhodomonas_salina.1
MVHAAKLCLEKGWSPRRAAEKVNRQYAISLSVAVVTKHCQRHGAKAPERRGRKLKLDDEAENQLVQIILLMRKMRLPTWKSIMKKICTGLMSGTKYERLFKNGEVADSWWKRFCWRHAAQLKLGHQRKQELQRERWTTAENLKTWYENLEELLVELGIAVPNPEFDPNQKFSSTGTQESMSKCSRILIKKPDRLCSVDETEVTTNMSGGSQQGRTSSELILMATDGSDHGETLTNKTSQRTT